MAETILETIVASVRARLPDRKSQAPRSVLESRPNVGLAVRPFAEALRRERGPAVIAEIKRASPSAGVLRENFDVGAIAAAYDAAGADAVSVVTESDHFLGDVGMIETARECTRLPVLRKDFIIDPWQVLEARAFGADAVLLIASILGPDQLEELIDAADELGLATLVEVHREAELERLDLERIRILGVNNRDLRTFDVDVERAPRILADVPKRIVRVAESGIRTGGEVARLGRAGIDAVLVGEAFMRAADPGAALLAMRRDAVAFEASRMESEPRRS